MSAPLREPFFLKGRHYLLQRAVAISLALGGLAVLAGLAHTIVSEVLMTFLRPVLPANYHLALHSSFAALALAIFVGIPYSRWHHQSLQSIAIRVLWMTLMVAVPFWALAARQDLLDAGNRHLAGLMGDTIQVPLEWVIFYSLLWAGWSSAYFRCTWTWALLAALSWLSVPLVIASFNCTTHISDFSESWWPGFRFRLLARPFLSYLGQFAIMLSIPWGIPFWWPPEKEAGVEV